MKIVVFGASGGVGRHAVQVAREHGHDVVAAARGHAEPPGEPPGAQREAPAGWGTAELRILDVRDRCAVLDVLAGVDAALWCVGVTKRSGGDVGRVGLPYVVEGAHRHRVERLISVSGAGVTIPGDHKARGARVVSALTRRLAHDLVVDKEGEHAVLVAASDLAWTEVRPPRLRDAEGTGGWHLDREAPGLSAAAVAKRDVASAMVALAQNREWVRASPFLHARRG